MSRRSVSLVDLGSNSARLVVYEFEPGGGLQLVDEIREVIRLGAGVRRSGRLSDNAIGRALVALRTFGDYVQATGLPHVRIMATSAVRTAENRDEFLHRVRELGLEIEVLSGEEEAAQGVLAVANTTRLADAWVIDLGGGSAQLSTMRERRYTGGTAHPLGAITATELYLESDPPTGDQIAALEAAVDEHLGAELRELSASGMPLVALGGTVRNLARAVQKRTGYVWPLMHGYEMPTSELEELTERLIAKPAAGRGRVPGINQYRGDVIVAGAIVYRHIARRAGLDRILISGFGMREGALFQGVLEPPHLLPDVRAFGVDNLLWRYPQPARHNARVVELSLRLFDELAPAHGFGDSERELLAHAAKLHDIGKAVHFRGHDRHGAYLVAAAPLPGFDHREQALVSLLVRHHRSGGVSRAPYRPLLDDTDRDRLAKLTACLRLAEYLDRSRTGRIRDVRAEIEAGEVALELLTHGEPWVEFWESQKQAPLFEAAFGLRLRLQVVPL